jgi:hypothetical protein
MLAALTVVPCFVVLFMSRYYCNGDAKIANARNTGKQALGEK